jgi:hypothetical protein
MDLGGMIYIPSFMKTGSGIQTILRFCLSNSKFCNVDISDGRYLIYAVEMGSGGTIYVPSSSTIDASI